MRKQKLPFLACVGLLAGCLTLAACGSGDSAIPQTNESVQPLQTLRVGYFESAPGSFTASSGELSGWEVELINEAARNLGLNAEFVAMQFSEIIPEVESGNVDLGVASIFDTPERQVQVDFVNYFQGGTAWAALTSTIQAPFDPCGWSVAGIKGTAQLAQFLPSVSTQCLTQGKDPITILTVDNVLNAVDLVRLGEVDAFVADSPVVAYAVQSSGGQLAQAGVVEEIQLYGMAVSKDNPSLSADLTQAFANLMSDGWYERLLGKWGVEDGIVANFGINGGGAGD